MAKYSDKFKYSIVKKMMPLENQSVSQIARETGLSEATLHKWKKQARAKGLPMPGGEQETERWSTQDKFLIVMETSSLSEMRVDSLEALYKYYINDIYQYLHSL